MYFFCSVKHYFAYLSLFSLFNRDIVFDVVNKDIAFDVVKFVFSPYPSLTLGDLLCVSILDLVRILGSTVGWFPCKISLSLV